MNFLDFAEIKPGAIVTVVDGMLVAVELTMVVTGRGRDYSSHAIRKIPEELFDSSKFVLKNLPGQGNNRIKLLSMNDAMELIMVLPGNMAKDFRVKCASIIRRYLAGDPGLVDEIQANATSTAPINQLAREMDPEPTLERGEDDLALSKRRRVARVEKLEVEVQREKVQNMLGEAHAKSVMSGTYIQTVDSYKSMICFSMQLMPDGKLSDSQRDTFMEGFQNMVKYGQPFAPQPPASLPAGAGMANDNLISYHEAPGAIRNNEEGQIYISSVASHLGFKCDTKALLKIGLELKKAYVEKYQAEPKKVMREYKNGVNYSFVYTKKDQDLMVEAIKKICIADD